MGLASSARARLTLPVYYDFASTIAFVAHRVLERMAAEIEALSIDLEWRPVDLVAITGWPRGERVDGPRRENALRVARELGIEARMPHTFLDSRSVHTIALALAGHPEEATWRERVWSAIFEEGRDLSDRDELRRLGRETAIPVVEVVEEMGFGRLEAATDAAREAGVTGVPTFYMSFPLGGIQDPATMRLLLERWAAKQPL